jgi:hypothetical protein
VRCFKPSYAFGNHYILHNTFLNFLKSFTGQEEVFIRRFIMYTSTFHFTQEESNKDVTFQHKAGAALKHNLPRLMCKNRRSDCTVPVLFVPVVIGEFAT